MSRNLTYEPRALFAALQRAVLAVALSCALLATSASGVRALDTVGGIDLATKPPLRAQAPAVDMPAGALVAEDGRQLWARDPDERRAMASTTKIMTAIVALEQASLDETVPITGSSVSVGESSAGIRSGERLTVRELLEGLLVKSGNDAAEALAEHVAGTGEAFVEMMNAKAVELGLADTHFANTHGLDAPGHYSSAADLAVLARHAMGIEEFRRIVGLKTVTVGAGAGSHELQTSNLLIGTYTGTTGVKTGFTNRAGYCLIASAKRNGIELYAVVLGTGSEGSRFVQAKTLLDWGFAHYAPRQIASAEETLGAVPVADYLDAVVPVSVEANLKVRVFDFDGEVSSRLSLYESVRAPVKRGDRVGTLTVQQGDRLLAQVPVVATTSVEAPGVFERIWIAVVRVWRSMFGGSKMAAPVLTRYPEGEAS